MLPLSQWTFRENTRSFLSAQCLVGRAQDWKWSSVRVHLEGKNDGLVSVRPVLGRAADFAARIAGSADDAGFAGLRAAGQTGRPLSADDFIAGLERTPGRPIARRMPGRKPRHHPQHQPQLLQGAWETLPLSPYFRFEPLNSSIPLLLPRVRLTADVDKRSIPESIA